MRLLRRLDTAMAAPDATSISEPKPIGRAPTHGAEGRVRQTWSDTSDGLGRRRFLGNMASPSIPLGLRQYVGAFEMKTGFMKATMNGNVHC